MSGSRSLHRSNFMHEVNQRPLTVLLVEEEEDQKEEVQRMLAGADSPGIRLEAVGYLADALERLSTGGVDLILLDLDLPDSEGTVTFERLNAFAPDVPIVVLTDLDDEEVAMSTVKGGAQDYLLKEDVEAELLHRAIRYAVERHRLLSALRSLSLIDDVTDLYNRRGFQELGEQQLKLARRMGRGVVIFYMDVDRFKTINDTLGHHVGDRALARVSDLARGTFRRSDLIARMGGDEFAVLALEASRDDADLMVERLREQLDDFNHSSREPYQLSLSLGMCRVDPENPQSLEDLLRDAEEDMKREKEEKRPVISP